MRENKERKLSRATASLEKDGKRRRKEVLQHTINHEGEIEIDDYCRQRSNSDGTIASIRGSDEPFPNVQ